MNHTLLVANDFPPKHGGIQTYLHELVRRLPAGSVTVLTTPHPDAAAFDSRQPFRVERTREPVLLPTPALARRINTLAREVGAAQLLLDPPIPLGLLHRRLDLPFQVVLHGGVVAYSRPPAAKQLLAGVLRSAVGIVAAGEFTAGEARRAAGAATPPVTVIPPGVDPDRFRPLTATERDEARIRFGLPTDATLVLGLSRLVPRKGFDVLIDAVAELASARPSLLLAVGGAGRDRSRLERRAAAAGAPVTFVGRVPDELLPAAYGCADVFGMLCRNRWGGLEQEGFGIVFLEAAACGVPQIAGDSGGAAEAVLDGVTGAVVRRPADVAEVATALAPLVDDHERRAALGAAARQRAVDVYAYDHLARRLAEVLAS